ncbi:class I SAM-dependent methyltransferase [Nocardioides campestrisoli]|uniref:class I SAM-dependent methyltransferase n=1 Tax=Nocardioides campestrisoli TaxID=2736757 RepID=UPI0015E6372C|nr:methyltransferase domain-containing protein [Nocardioides campestrisoli]
MAAQTLQPTTWEWHDDTVRERKRAVADRIIAIANPKTTLDLGCGSGLLVQALAEKGVDARGIDVDDEALAGAHPEVRDRLEVHDWSRSLPQRYDLVSCFEALEATDGPTAQAIIDAVCAATDRVLFSPSREGLLLDGFSPWEWAASFAERGFFRRTDLNLDFLSVDAVLFERADLQPRDIVHRYESAMAPLEAGLREQRALLGRQARDRSATRRVAELEGLLRKAQHDVLTTRDHIIGLEAEKLQLQVQATRLNNRVVAQQERVRKLRTKLTNQQRRAERAESKLDQVRTSRAWRIGRRLARGKTPEL